MEDALSATSEKSRKIIKYVWSVMYHGLPQRSHFCRPFDVEVLFVCQIWSCIMGHGEWLRFSSMRSLCPLVLVDAMPWFLSTMQTDG